METMEIYLKNLQELVWLNDAIIKEYDKVKDLDSQVVYIAFDGFMYPTSFIIKQKQNKIMKMLARKANLEGQFENLDSSMLYSLYEFIATYNMGNDKIPMICYLFELINRKERVR